MVYENNLNIYSSIYGLRVTPKPCSSALMRGGGAKKVLIILTWCLLGFAMSSFESEKGIPLKKIQFKYRRMHAHEVSRELHLYARRYIKFNKHFNFKGHLWLSLLFGFKIL